MNEVICLSTFVILCLLAGGAAKQGLKILYILSIFIIIVSNITVGIQVNAFGISVSLGVIIYSIIYLVTDIVSEFYPKNEAYKLAFANLIAQIVFFIYIFISTKAEPSGGQEAFSAMKTLFATTPRITIAAIVAAIGAFADIAFYEWLMHKAKSNPDGYRKGLWVRNILSTFFGQSINTAIFFTIALYGVLPNLLSIILSAIAIKWCIALLDTPFLYWAKFINERGMVSTIKE